MFVFVMIDKEIIGLMLIFIFISSSSKSWCCQNLLFTVWRFKQRQCNVSVVSIVLWIPKCILIVPPLLSMCRQAIFFNVVSTFCNICFPHLLPWCIGSWSLLFLGQHSIIKSLVSATIAYRSLYVSSIRFWTCFFISDCVPRCIMSFFMRGIFDCTLSQQTLIPRWISSGLLSSSGVLYQCFWCLVHIGMLTFFDFCHCYRLRSCQCFMCRLPTFFAQVCQKAISHCCWCVGSLILVCHHGRLYYLRGRCFGLISCVVSLYSSLSIMAR